MDDECKFYFSVNANPAFNVIPTLYIWDFGDGSPLVYTTTPNTTHSYPAPGGYSGVLKVVGYNVITGECCSEEVPFDVENPCDKRGGGEGDDGTTARKTSNINHTQLDNSLSIAPNPSKGTLNLEMKSVPFNKLVISDVMGKKVYSEEFEAGNAKQIKLETLSNGHYIIELQDVNGMLHTGRFVINK